MIPKALAIFQHTHTSTHTVWTYVYSVLLSWETQTNAFFPLHIKVLWIADDIHVAPTFSFLWDKQFQIPYLFLIFCSPGPLWPLTLSPGYTFVKASLKIEPKNRPCSLCTPLHRQRDRCLVNERLHCEQWGEMKLPLMKSPPALRQYAYAVLWFTLSCSNFYLLKLLNHYLLNFKDCLTLEGGEVSHLWLIQSFLPTKTLKCFSLESF